jgi:hypothetical protein
MSRLSCTSTCRVKVNRKSYRPTTPFGYGILLPPAPPAPPLAAISERIDRLKVRINRKARVGTTSIRAFLRGEPDPFPELGPPNPNENPRSMRGFLFGQTFDLDSDDYSQSS